MESLPRWLSVKHGGIPGKEYTIFNRHLKASFKIRNQYNPDGSIHSNTWNMNMYLSDEL